jgi:hypothetical protein
MNALCHRTDCSVLNVLEHSGSVLVVAAPCLLGGLLREVVIGSSTAVHAGVGEPL